MDILVCSTDTSLSSPMPVSMLFLGRGFRVPSLSLQKADSEQVQHGDVTVALYPIKHYSHIEVPDQGDYKQGT